ncbi:hypothetical protein GN958_ATG08487 [Phytophthora infestans]|uniref:EF-hand domain-containing protein n=1 Tax=Phytophthora infestans TaxID=4787 RepID=A0A8S9UNB5_PHYIN|nr:hypothetical protein GN958_ATG08487 [Phytophthora infestans]
MESLDVGYALLSDVNARNRELQARLRSSLPLLWTTNALVMTNAAGPRRRKAAAEQWAVGEADQMLIAIEGQSSLRVGRRYKRRVEWEVSRRIARVDRELQQYPPGKRSWNQKRRELTPAQPSSYKPRESSVGRTETRRTAPARHAVSNGVKGKATGNQQERKVWEKPRITTEAGGEVRRVLKHVATSPLRGVVEDKENAKPNAAVETELNTKDPPVVTAKNKEEHETLDEPPVPEEAVEDSKAQGPIDGLDTISNAPSIKLAEVKLESPRKSSSIPTANIPQDSGDDDIFAIKGESPRRIKAATDERPSSSIGRQVLSDFRTMPSVASFGAQPILSGGMGNQGDMRLNSDVLRRLFSDLDTDKDGHVNRIETCMALHRLQISVPTTKIISFFRHIHSSDAKGPRSRRTSHLPMKEVINYKEFVAFVTAAYDQQQQRKAQRRRAPTRREQVPPPSAPSMSLPIYEQPTISPRTRQSARAPPPSVREEDIRAYEVKDEPKEAAMEDRIFQELPDVLVSRILADTRSAANVEVNENVVRRSLESLVGKEAVDDKMVNDITQELIRERLRRIAALTHESTDDTTGLKRAEAYYNEQMARGGTELESAAEDSSSQGFKNWVDVLTEEQVSGLVQQIWKDRQALRHVSLAPVEDVHIEDTPGVPEEPPVRWKDEATDTNELDASPTKLSEKAVQTFDEIKQEEPQSTPEQEKPIDSPEESHENMQDSNSDLPQTHLGGAILNSLAGSSRDSDSRELFHPATSIEILQQPRQQRRLGQSSLHDQQDPSRTDKAEKTNPEPNVSAPNEQSFDVHINTESVFSSEESHESVSNSIEEQAQETQNQDVESSPTSEPVALTQKMLDLDDSLSYESSLELVNSLSVSSSDFSSSSDYYRSYGISREIDRHLLTTTRSFRRRPFRRRRRLSVSGSSVPDSICSAELSEGEISREEGLALSDGEVFGESRRAYTKCKNAVSYAIESEEESSLRISIESGELPALLKVHATFRRQLVAQSTSSSFESGEFEDGYIPDK